MRSCIFLFYIPLLGLVAAGAQDTPDALYHDRAHLASARRAADIWRTRLAAAPSDFDSAWKLARAQYWLGTQGLPRRERKAALEAGVQAGRTAARLHPRRPEGHFWMAANMAALAEAHGLRHGLQYRNAIRQALETVRALDPAFQQGSADRALGRWYHKVPAWLGGDQRKSEAHLRTALTYNPHSVITRLFLAETLIALERPEEARRELQAAIDAPDDPDWTPEDAVFRQRARHLMRALQ